MGTRDDDDSEWEVWRTGCGEEHQTKNGQAVFTVKKFVRSGVLVYIAPRGNRQLLLLGVILAVANIQT